MGAEQDKLRVAAVQAHAEALQANIDKASTAALLASHQRKQINVDYRTVTKDVKKLAARPVYRNNCLDADGLRQPMTLYAVPQPQSTVPAVPASLAQPFPDLPLIEGEDAKAVMQWALSAVKLYRVC